MISVLSLVTGCGDARVGRALPRSKCAQPATVSGQRRSKHRSRGSRALVRIAPGQFADFAILSVDYFTVPEEQIRGIESVLTVTGGEVVYSADPFTAFAPDPLPPASRRGPR